MTAYAGRAGAVPPAAAGRRRAVTWEDPGVGAALALELSGLDYLHGIAEGLGRQIGAS